MKRILFVCHGNICRSPMAEYAFRNLVRKAGLENDFACASAATSTEEIGNGVYPPVARLLHEAGIDCSQHRARQMTRADYGRYDYVVAMDRYNLRNIERLVGADTQGKIRLLLPHAEVADPWYTRDFDTAWTQIRSGCADLLDELK